MNRPMLTLGVCLIFFTSTWFANAQGEPTAIDFSNTLAGKIAIAAISAILSLVVGYILFFVKDRKELRSRISFDVEFKKGMLGIDERLVKDLHVTYKGKSARQIGYVICTLSNTGTSVVRNQRIRVEFSKEAEVLEWRIDPAPPKEFGIASPADADDQKNERTFAISYLPVEQQISLHFVVDGETSGDIRLFGFNADEDVKVVPGSISAALGDRLVVERFVLLYALTLFIPRALGGIPIFGDMAAGIFYVIATIIALPLIPAVARIIAKMVSVFGEKGIHLGEVRGSTVIIGENINSTQTDARRLPQQT